MWELMFEYRIELEREVERGYAPKKQKLNTLVVFYFSYKIVYKNTALHDSIRFLRVP